MARPKPPTTGLSAKVSPVPRSRHMLSSIFLHRQFRTPRREGNGAMSRFSTLCRNRLIYYTSIKQRERKKFRQLNCPFARLKSSERALCMLTYPFYLLSKPNSPGVDYVRFSATKTMPEGEFCNIYIANSSSFVPNKARLCCIK